ncbi:helix-turn-helix domain-containing protein [Gorillibacterium massiliense]|uniref:helix-turn-helix domain-containing protein n=1 Tax=Gorillibacterium massiliense TaxID=1280390 RepID=UPI0004B9501B|nr:helix-turn-helix transcriptional regulator [Gorillibacterium massiliense]
MSRNSEVPIPGSLVRPTSTIHTWIEREMAKQNITITDLARRSGIARAPLSDLLSRDSSRSFSVQHLDLIGEALGQPEGWLYEYYIQMNFLDGKVHWRQVKLFLNRCIELEKDDCIKMVLDIVSDEAAHIQDVFLFAESVFAQGKWKASIPFYKFVCENEIRQHSERLAISHYRWFRAALGRNLKENHEAAVQFAPYRQRLPEDIQLDSLLQLANVHFSLHQWDKVIEYADEMKALLYIILYQKKTGSGTDSSEANLFKTERHLVFYYGQSFLLKGNALEWMGQYEDSLKYISGYEDLSWFDDLDEVGWQEVQKFKRFATANRYNLNVLMGDFTYLPDYLDFLDHYPEEWLPSLLTIMNAINRYGYDADSLLDRFKSRIDELAETETWTDHAYYQGVFQRDRCAWLCYELALYSFSKSRFQEGTERLLNAMFHSIASNNKNLIINCTAYFGRYRDQASEEQRTRYEHLMKGVIEDAQIAFVSASGEFPC